MVGGWSREPGHEDEEEDFNGADQIEYCDMHSISSSFMSETEMIKLLS